MTPPHVQVLRKALRLLQAKQTDEAERVLAPLRDSRPRDADVWRLSGAVARARREFVLAETYLRETIRLVPTHHEAWNALGLALAEQGRSADAQSAWKTALKLAPNQPSAAINLARHYLAANHGEAARDVVKPFSATDGRAALVYAQALRLAGDPEKARGVYQSLLDRQPDDRRVVYGMALCAIDLGRPDEALKHFDVLSGEDDPVLEYARFTALVRLGRLEEAEHAVRAVLRIRPYDPAGLDGVAQLLNMTGRADEVPALFEEAQRASGFALPVDLQFITTLVSMGELELARERVKEAQARHGPIADVMNLAISVEVEAGLADQAFNLAQLASERFSNDGTLLANRVRAALMAGEPKVAAPLIRDARRSRPQDQFWTAMDASLARLNSDEAAYRILCDPSYIMTAQLEPPPAYGGIERFNQQLADELRAMHSFSAAPLGQSLRSGTQTTSDLRHSESAVLRDFFAMVEVAFRRYRSALSASHGHPLLGRIPAEMRLQGAWSVRLGPEGRHVNHVHPEGWISSVYYVSVPPQVRASPSREGWLKFGEPPFHVPGLDAHDHIEPKAGELTLFPSYLWHGTVPIQSGERLTIAFDIAPSLH